MSPKPCPTSCPRHPFLTAKGLLVLSFSIVLLNILSAAAIQARETSLPDISHLSEAQAAKDCATCHPAETRRWRSSHHAGAMAEAVHLNQGRLQPDKQSLLGDFNNATATHLDLKANFKTIDGHPVMSLTRSGKTTHHIVSYSFGVFPLQQYLTETDDGRWQVLPFFWDARSAEDGGQRWITLHPQESISAADRLHWQQPLANWNGMCADCHSTGLVRNFSPAENRFDTKFSQISVSCGSCHGPQPHTNNPISSGSTAGFAPRFPIGHPGKSAASQRPPSKEAAQSTLEICAGCHSLRSPLVDGIDPREPFLDQFAPALPAPVLYFPDGQAKEEVYVWGSFLQSRMHKEGVTCGNCHDPHSQKLVVEGNALCSQCHAKEIYDVETHHRHKLGTEASQCVNCHMPVQTYMVVDDRRDHSFRVPDISASRKLNTPDPCTTCHINQSKSWAEQSLADWQPSPATAKASSSNRLWQQLQSGVALTPTEFAQLMQDPEVAEIKKASALTEQAKFNPQIKSLPATEGQPLLAVAVAHASAQMPLNQREALLGPMLNHKYRAVRIAAANQLRESVTNTTATSLSAQDFAQLKKVLEEANTADNISSWRGEGLLNRGLHQERGGDLDSAIESYLQAIDRDPYFEPPYINLAELYRKQKDLRREQLLYTKALRAIPDSAILRYSYALHLVRRKAPAKAVQQTAQALQRDPASRNNAYLHLLLLDNLGRTAEGVAWLTENIEHQKASIQVLQLGAKQAQKIGAQQSFSLFAKTLRNAH